MATTPLDDAPRLSAWSETVRGFPVQSRVVGALILRELHTRYGRENVGYLWLLLEPLMLGSVFGLLHLGQKTHYGSDINPMAFTIVGYTVFIMFRGIVNRSAGALEVNVPLLYHRQVTSFDIVISRALLEAAGTFLSFSILITLCSILGVTDLPYRPLYLLAGIIYVLWMSTAISFMITSGTYNSRTLERLVHPFTYFMIPLSGAFFQLSWIPEPYRGYMLWNPLPQAFELVRYGQFRSATDDYFSFQYLTGCCLVLSLIGLAIDRGVKSRIHLS